MTNAAQQWDLEQTAPPAGEDYQRRRAELRARYYSIKCSTYSMVGTRTAGAASGRPPSAPTGGGPASPPLPTSSWERIREAIGIVTGLPADALEDTERLYDD